MTSIKTIYKIGLLAISFASCSPNQTTDTTIDNQQNTTKEFTLADITNYLSTKTETFKVNQTKDTLLYCKKGTVIFLPANSLQFQDGTSPDKAVKIDVNECYSITDFIGENLSTLSDSNLLVTVGMIKITASVDQKNVIVKKKNEYAIYFPKRKKSEAMKLFYGNPNSSGRINWLPSDDSVIERPKENSLEQLNACKISIASFTSMSQGKSIGWKIKNTKQTVFNYFSNNFNPSKEMLKDFCSHGYYASFKFKIDNTGNINSIESTSIDKIKPEYNKILSDFINSIPPLDTTSMASSLDMTYTLEFQGRNEVDKKIYNKEFRNKYSLFKNNAITKIGNAELSYYVLTATKFEWINCDMFWNTTDEKIDFFVKTDSPDKSSIKIVFADNKCIMDGILDGDKFVFNNVPINRKIKIIGISFDNDKPTMSIARTTVEKLTFNLTGFKEFTLNQLETELNKTN